MSWKQVRLAIILGLLVMLFVSPYVVSVAGQTSITPEKPPADDTEKLEDIWVDIKDVWSRTTDIYQSVKADISVGATEYSGGEEGVIFAKVTVVGQPIDNAHCDTMIFNSSKAQIDGFELTYVNGSRGIYSANFTVPTEVGVYMVDVVCVEPTDESFQEHHFMGDGDPAYDLYFKNSTQTGNTTRILLTNVGDEIMCHPDRFSVAYSDFDNGEFEPYRFLRHIHNLTIYVQKDIGASKEYTVILRFYKETQYGELTLGAVINTTLISTTPIKLSFPEFYVNAPWDDLALLEVEFCAKTIAEFDRDVEFLFGSVVEDSGFVIHTQNLNATTNFEVGGSSEIHISPAFDDFWRRVRNLLLILHSTEVTNTSCLNNNTLREEKFIVYEIGESGYGQDDINLSKYQHIHCNWGCSNSACNPDPLWRNIILLIIIIVILCIVAGLLRLGGVV